MFVPLLALMLFVIVYNWESIALNISIIRGNDNPLP